MSTNWIPGLSGRAHPDVERAIRIAYENIYQLRGMLDSGKDSKGQTVSNLEILRRLEIAIALVETLLTIIATPLNITTYSALGLSSAAPTDTAWPTASQARFLPFSVNVKTIVSKIFSVVGANPGAGANTDVGIYSNGGVRLVSSGSTGNAAANTVQIFSISSVQLQPGRYYLAQARDDTTSTTFAYTSVAVGSTLLGGKIANTSMPLPNTVSLIDSIIHYTPIMGIFTG